MTNTEILIKYNEQNAKKWSEENANVILNYILEKGYWTKPLTFVEWYNAALVAKDKFNRRYVIFGSYVGGRFVFTSILREKTKGKAMTWLINGEPAKNAEIIAIRVEQDSIEFPELTKACNELRNLK